jgi:NADH-quinone oxidoreductase subunit F
VIPSISFLKAFNQRGESLARGRVGVVGGGNSALDAARTALRQEGVESVTIFYRRTRDEMPAFTEEVDAAVEEGVRLETLTSPVRVLVEDGRFTGLELVKNRLGDVDASGRRRPVPVPGTEHTLPLDTLIVAISEGSDTDCVAVAGANRVDITSSGTIRIDPETLATNRPGVFAGGDVVTGPNTVVEAIAAGKKAAVMIDRYLAGEPLRQPAEVRLPTKYVEPLAAAADEAQAGAPWRDTSRQDRRVPPPSLSAAARRRTFTEVERTFSVADATREATRCLRCDLAFTRPAKVEEPVPAEAGGAP